MWNDKPTFTHNYLKDEPKKFGRVSCIKLKFFKKLLSKCGQYSFYRISLEEDKTGRTFQVQANEKVLKKLIIDILGDENDV
jgi:hypothetical protein